MGVATMKTFNITIRAYRNGQRIHLKETYEGVKADDMAKAFLKCCSEWKRLHEGRWYIDLVRGEEVNENA